MKTYQGDSHHTTLPELMDELFTHFPEDDAPDRADVILVFASTAQPAKELLDAIHTRYPSALLVGCTTSGEHITGSHHNASVVVTGLHTPEITWASCLIEQLDTCDEVQVQDNVKRLFDTLHIDPADEFPIDALFGVLLIDGLSMCEEHITAMCSDALEGIALVGGSAGDDLKFEATHIFYQGAVLQNAAVLLLAHTQLPFHIIKEQHFYTTPERLAITRADVAKRIVYEMDGYPAAQAYARAIGIPREELDADACFLHPLSFQTGGELYMRSIMSINEDDSLSFYCAIEEGMVLDVSNAHDMSESLSNSLADTRAEFILGFHCILRSLEAQNTSQHSNIAEILSKHSAASIGFDTYGEQLKGLHINQTLLALALGHELTQEHSHA